MSLPCDICIDVITDMISWWILLQNRKYSHMLMRFATCLATSCLTLRQPALTSSTLNSLPSLRTSLLMNLNPHRCAQTLACVLESAWQAIRSHLLITSLHIHSDY